MVREILFYRTRSGRSPVEEFIESLSEKQIRKVTWVFDLVEETQSVPGAYLSKLSGTDDLWEIRVDFGGDAFRFLGFFEGRRLVVLVSAFAKKTQKTPALEIGVAESRKREYLGRKEREEP